MIVTKDYGVTIEQIEMSCPKELEPYDKAFELQKRLNDEQMWLMGSYVQNAVCVALDRALNGKKATLQYLEKPMLTDYFEKQNMSQEEMDRREIEKMLQFERIRKEQDNLRGLPTFSAK